MEWAVMLVSDVLSWAALAGLCTNRREWVNHGPWQLAPEGAKGLVLGKRKGSVLNFNMD